MSRKTRIILGLLILATSVALLLWGFLPARHDTRTLPISPSDLQLPTPSSLRFDTSRGLRAGLLNASLIQPVVVS